ncbi:hypothetical protein B0H19DRAFT_1204466 [Mycena capillaripes]|nr:hypothetical protein B0H19DRAFT_1204466 [Mycena capillaripes]
MAAPPNFLPIPVVPPLVLQPVPVPNPALPQTNWNALSGAMQTVAAETANIPNSVCVLVNQGQNTTKRGNRTPCSKS